MYFSHKIAAALKGNENMQVQLTRMNNLLHDNVL